jgi:hypothetical protein
VELYLEINHICIRQLEKSTEVSNVVILCFFFQFKELKEVRVRSPNQGESIIPHMFVEFLVCDRSCKALAILGWIRECGPDLDPVGLAVNTVS